MIKRLLATCVLLLLAGIACAELKVEGETKVAAYKLVTLKIKSSNADAAFLWQPFPEGLDTHLHDDGMELILTGPPGTYRLGVISGYNDKNGKLKLEQAYVTVVIGGGGPAPPPVPPPDDPLVKTFRAAYDAETDAKKAEHKANLAAIYRQSAKAGYLDQFATGADMDAAMGKAVVALNGPQKITGVQKAVRDEIRKTVEVKTDTELTPEIRSKLITAFLRVATALDAVK